MVSHLLEQLNQRRVAYVATDGKRLPIAVDPPVMRLLESVVAKSSQEGAYWVTLPSARTSIPVFAALSVAWECQGKSDNSVVLLVTKDPSALETAHRHAPVAVAVPRGQYNLLKIVKMSKSIRNIGKRLEAKKWEFRPRLIILDDVTPELITKLDGVGSVAVCGVIDERTVEVADDQLAGDMCWFRMGLSPLQRPKGWKDITEAADDFSGQEGLLQVCPVPLEHVRQRRVSDPCHELWALLVRLHRGQAPSVFLAEAWNLAWLISGLPVKPSETGRQFIYRQGRVGQPLEGSLQILRAVAASCKESGLYGTMDRFIHEAGIAISNVEHHPEKRDAILELVRDVDDCIVVVRGRGLQVGLQEALEAEGLQGRCRVVTWRDPATWMPHDGHVIVASSPPPGRAWLVATHCNLGRDVQFVLTSAEAKRLRSGLTRLGVTRGIGLKALDELVAVESPDGPVDDLPDDISDWLSSYRIGVGGLSRNRGAGADEMICLFLENGARFFTRAGSRVAKIVAGGVRLVPVRDIDDDDFVLLPNDAVEDDVKQAAFKAFESHEPKARAVFEQWKDEFAAAVADRDHDEILAELHARGAHVTQHQLERLFFMRGTDHEQMTVLDDGQLIRATLAMSGSALTLEEVAQAITRLWGLHILAGKFLQTYAKLDFFGTADDWDTVISSEYGITRSDVAGAVSPHRILAVSDPFPADAGIQQFRSEGVSQ